MTGPKSWYPGPIACSCTPISCHPGSPSRPSHGCGSAAGTTNTPEQACPAAGTRTGCRRCAIAAASAINCGYGQPSPAVKDGRFERAKGCLEHASAACAWARRPGRRQGNRHPAWRAGGRVCRNEGFHLHRQGPAGVSSQITSAAVQGRSSGPIQPAAGISALSTETICGPKLRPPGCPAPRSRHRGLASSQVSGGGGGI
jgi:hypothetical protein